MGKRIYRIGLRFPRRRIHKRKPGKKELEDIKFGLKAAKKLADADIGQTVIIKNKKSTLDDVL